MYKYRISKYNPSYRDNDGRYLKEEWTAISDIGKAFDGVKLSIEEYKKIEDSYIKVIQLIMNYVGVQFLTIDKVVRSFSNEKFEELFIATEYRHLYTSEILDIYHRVRDKENLDKERIDQFCRLLLREDIGAKIFYQNKIKVFIGYDYLMGIHTSKSLEKLIPEIEELGLYVEEF
ncbi:MAG: hypothetical protein E7206_24505 [Clostridium beijerinckii]|nr:hypothetical protein [Clostridium beijerinckii]